MVPSRLVPLLASAANFEVRHALAYGAPSFVSPPTREVGYVAALVLGAVPAIATAWRTIFSTAGIQISITGVFCHSSPQVEFKDKTKGTERRELADLLLVHDEMSGTSIGARRAVLVQAKMATGVGTVSGSSVDLPQLHLYEVWPLFSIKHSAFAQHNRDFKTAQFAGKPIDDGRYGIIDATSKQPLWHLVEPKTPPMSTSAGPEIGTFMAEMLDVSIFGRGREAKPQGTDDWSFTIDELLRITANRQFTHKLSFGPNVTYPAGTTVVVQPDSGTADWATSRLFWGAAPGGPDKTTTSEPDDVGLSTIRIVTRRTGPIFPRRG